MGSLEAVLMRSPAVSLLYTYIRPITDALSILRLQGKLCIEVTPTSKVNQDDGYTANEQQLIRLHTSRSPSFQKHYASVVVSAPRSAFSLPFFGCCKCAWSTFSGRAGSMPSAACTLCSRNILTLFLYSLTFHRCPFDAIQIINLPTNLSSEVTHRYSANSVCGTYLQSHIHGAVRSYCLCLRMLLVQTAPPSHTPSRPSSRSRRYQRYRQVYRIEDSRRTIEA